MNFEPADPPLLDPFILERFTDEEIRRQEQTNHHKYVLKKLADFLPKQSPNSQQLADFLPKQSPNSQQLADFLPKQSPTSQQLAEFLPKQSPNSQQLADFLPKQSPNSLIKSEQTHQILSEAVKCQLANQFSTPPLVPAFSTGFFPPNINVKNTSNPFSFQSRETLPLLSQPGPQSPPIKPPSPPETQHRPPAGNVIKPRATKRFTYSQSVVLEDFFQKYGSARIVDRIALAQKLGLYKNDVIGWFQSRRRKERRANGGSSYSQKGLAPNGNTVQICSSEVR